METVPVIDCSDGSRKAAAGGVPVILTKSASYVITNADLTNAGGHLMVIESGSSAAVDFTLPSAAGNRGDVIRIQKTRLSTTAVSALASGGAKIQGGTANKRFENVTSEIGSLTLVCDGTDWFVISAFGSWIANNT